MPVRITIAREIAYDAFIEVMENKKRPDLVCEELFDKHRAKLKRLDRNFVKEMLFGSLRWYSKMYWILQNVSKRDLDKVSPQVRAALILGTYQVFYMDRVPDRAAVNESAEYVRAKGQASAVSFVNGILRQIARRSQYFQKPDKDKQQGEYLALQFAHPKWLVDRWLRRFKFEKVEELVAQNNNVPPYTIRINSLKTPTEDAHKLQTSLLKQEKTHSDRRPLRSCLTLKTAADLSQDSLFQKGWFTIQDEASQLIANLVAPQEKEVVVEACCGPGGKLSHIAELGNGKIELIGVEKNKFQMQKAQETAKRLEVFDHISWVEEDFLNFKPKKKVHKILLDAPCSGLGVLRRHPEGKWNKQSNLITEMADLQRILLEKAIALLAPKGELIYSVCSFEEDETIDQLQWVEKNFGDTIEIIAPQSRLPDYYKRYVTKENLLLIYSGNKDRMDGFGAFIAKKKK